MTPHHLALHSQRKGVSFFFYARLVSLLYSESNWKNFYFFFLCNIPRPPFSPFKVRKTLRVESQLQYTPTLFLLYRFIFCAWALHILFTEELPNNLVNMMQQKRLEDCVDAVGKDRPQQGVNEENCWRTLSRNTLTEHTLGNKLDETVGVTALKHYEWNVLLNLQDKYCTVSKILQLEVIARQLQCLR